MLLGKSGSVNLKCANLTNDRIMCRTTLAIVSLLSLEETIFYKNKILDKALPRLALPRLHRNAGKISADTGNSSFMYYVLSRTRPMTVK